MYASCNSGVARVLFPRTTEDGLVASLGNYRFIRLWRATWTALVWSQRTNSPPPTMSWNRRDEEAMRHSRTVHYVQYTAGLLCTRLWGGGEVAKRTSSVRASAAEQVLRGRKPT